MNIIIVGGGFGGIKAALDIEKKIGTQASITLIDRNPYHLFIPAIYEVAAAYSRERDPFSVKLRETVCIPFSKIFEGKKVNFIQAEVESVDLKDKKVVTGGGCVSSYDYLVLAVGSESADFGVPGVKEYACQFKTINDALMINKKIYDIFLSGGDGTRYPKIIVCGGGFTGVELIAEIACWSKKMLRWNKMKNIHPQFVLFEAGPKILSMVSDEEREIVRRRLTNIGVAITESAAIEEIKSDSVRLKNGRDISADIIIWTAGIRPPNSIKNINGLELSKTGRIQVNEYMGVNSFHNVFAVGDITSVLDSDTQKTIPALAYVAADQGRIAAANIVNAIRGKKPRTYHPRYNVWIAPVGGKFALAHLWGWFSIKGFLGWVLREIVDLRYFLSILTPVKAVSLFRREVTIFTKND